MSPLTFWLIKIAVTTLGETGGDAVGAAIFATIFVVAVAAQIAAKLFHPFLYWAVIVATTTVGTTLADYFDRSVGIGYAGGASVLRLAPTRPASRMSRAIRLRPCLSPPARSAACTRGA